MEKIFFSLLGAVLLPLGAAPRIAIFDEPGFPNASKRDAGFYQKVLNGKILKLNELGDLKDYDVLLFPHGGYVPSDAEKAVYRLMRRGGTVIVCGDLQEPLPPGKEKRPKVKDVKLLDYENKYGMPHGGPLSLVNGRWIVAPTGAVYDDHSARRWYEFLALSGWPNQAQSYAPNYMRPFDKTIYLNPVLKKSALPAKIEPVEKKVLLARLRPMGETGDHALDVFHPLYLFAAPGGKPYRPFVMAGKSAEDRASDGFILRKFRPDMFGATLVVMGKTGRMLLDSARGADTIQKIVKLATGPLPGSFPAVYIRKIHALEKAMQDYNLHNMALTAALKRLAVEKFPAGKHHKALVRLKVLRAEFTRYNNLFDGMMTLKERRKRVSIPGINFLVQALKKSSRSLQQELAPLKKYILPLDGGEARHPYKRFTLMTSNFGPWHVDDHKNWEKVKELGIVIPKRGSDNWPDMEKLNARYGFFSAYTAMPMHRGHADKKYVSSGVFDPGSGTVRKVRVRVWGKEAPHVDPVVIRHLQKVEKSSGIGVVIHGDERDFQWSLWGEYMLGLFRKFLSEKYQNISALNREYDSHYTSFEEITLPLKRPVTQTEHALWEDWTRYREIYRQKNELERWVTMIKKYAPSKRQWLYGSYHQQNRHPANGINYYETGKWLDPATLESSTNPRKEVMTYDIAAFGKKHVNPEWAGFYYPAGSRLANVNRMREFLWNEANCGTIGWHTFMGGVQSRSKWAHTPLITPNGNIQPEGMALRDTVRELNAARRFFLDGKRAEPEIRFVYSPTTRRHTSWPGIEEDRSYQCVTGLNEAFKALHIPARGIDEQAVWEGKLPDQCRYLIVPSVEYMNRKLFAALKKFMEKGGVVIASADSGRFDEYGHKREFLLEIAGVRAEKTFDKEFTFAVPERLNVLFPRETRILLRYENGSAAMTETAVGRGKLVICGYPVGREFNNTGKGLDALQKMAAVLGMDRPFICSDPHLVIRPWQLDGELYLACYYIHRDTVPVVKGDFPLRSAPVMIPFEINISGDVTARDLLSGTVLKSRKNGNGTVISGLIGNPGGCIIKLSCSRLPRRVIKERKKVKVQAVTGEAKRFSLPAQGKFFADWGKIRLGEYSLTIFAENDGAWQGKVFAALSKDGRTLKRECVPGSEISFRFNEKTVVFRCRNAQSFMPVNIEGRFTEKKNASRSGCRIDILEDKIILQNSYLYAAVLPGFGGRISELRVAENAPNQLLFNEKTLAEGLGKTYRDFGGIEYNAGAYQSAGWQIPYQYKVLKKTPGEILLRLNRSGKYTLPRGGEISYEIFYRIKADSPFLETTVHLFNEMASTATLSFRTHPVFLAGGDCSMQDVFCWQSPGGSAEMFFRPGRNQYVPNKGNYFACIDASAREGIIQTFDARKIPKLYLWSSRETYNIELHFLPVRTSAGKYAVFQFATAPVAGLGKVHGLFEKAAFELDTQKLTARLWGVGKQKINGALLLTQKGKILAQKNWKSLQTVPQKIIELALDKREMFPGKYTLTLQVDGESFSQNFTVADSGKSGISPVLEKLKAAYEKSPNPVLRKKIFDLSAQQ